MELETLFYGRHGDYPCVGTAGLAVCGRPGPLATQLALIENTVTAEAAAVEHRITILTLH